MSNYTIDTVLLGKIEDNPEAFFTNSPSRVREFLGCWTVILTDNIEAFAHVKKGDEYIDNYVADQKRTLARVKTLQEKQEKFKELMIKKEQELKDLEKQSQGLYDQIQYEEDAIRDAYEHIRQLNKAMDDMDDDIRRLKKELYGEEE